MEGQMLGLPIDQLANQVDDLILIDEPNRPPINFDTAALTASIDRALLNAIQEKDIYGYLKDAFCDGTLPFKEEFLITFKLLSNDQPLLIQSDIDLLLGPEVGPYTFDFISLSLIISPRLAAIMMNILLIVDTAQK